MSKHDASKILNQIVELYQNCLTYSDSGSVSCEVGNLQFRTYFCRPDQYKFEWTSTVAGIISKNSVYSLNGTKVISIHNEEKEEVISLAVAIAGATGVSFGVAPIAAHLLMPNLFQSGQYESSITQGSYKILEVSDSTIKLRTDWRANCWKTITIDKFTMALREIEEVFAPTLKEKLKGVEALERLQAPEAEAVRELLHVEDKYIPTVISYNHVEFDS